MRLQLGEHGHSGLCHTPHTLPGGVAAPNRQQPSVAAAITWKWTSSLQWYGLVARGDCLRLSYGCSEARVCAATAGIVLPLSVFLVLAWCYPNVPCRRAGGGH